VLKAIGARRITDPITGEWTGGYRLDYPTYRADDWRKFVAPLGPTERLNLERLQAATDPLGAGAGNLLRRTIEGEFLTPESNPFLGDYVRAASRDLLELYDEEERAQRALFTRAGQRIQDSSPFSAERRRRDLDLQQTLGDVAVSIYGPAYEAERSRQMSAIGQQLQLNLANIEQQQLPRLVQQEGIDRALQIVAAKRKEIQDALALALDASLQFGQASRAYGSTYTGQLSFGGSSGDGNKGGTEGFASIF
jgi:hypothetical protein